REAEGASVPGSVERLRKMQQDVADRQGIPGPAEVEAERAEKAKKITLADVTPDAPEPLAAELVDGGVVTDTGAAADEAIAEATAAQASTPVKSAVEF